MRKSMNFNRNTRISLTISLFAMVAVIAILCYINFNGNKSTSKTANPTNDIAFLSNTPQISSSTMNAQAYQGTLNITDDLNKNINIYYISSKSLTNQSTDTITETNASGIHNGTIYDDDSVISIDTTEYPKMIRQAVDEHARLIICPDTSYAETLYNIQNDYPNTSFILVDSVPHNPDNSDQTINNNIIPLNYDESEIGFLAGYALVYEGYTSLAFIGSINNTSVIRYGYGFLQGAEQAAIECNIEKVEISYRYAENINNATEIGTQYYNSGIPVIVTAGDDIAKPLHNIALEQNSYLVTCGNYYNSLEDDNQLIAIASKNISISVSDAISGFYSGNISGGKVINYDAGNNGISFDYNTAKFSKFNSDTYQDIYNRLANNDIKLISDTTVSKEDLDLTKVTIKQ